MSGAWWCEGGREQPVEHLPLPLPQPSTHNKEEIALSIKERAEKGRARKPCTCLYKRPVNITESTLVMKPDVYLLRLYEASLCSIQRVNDKLRARE
ncbi:hypothetical protein J6590_003056 [Homalodisca vitripennis]|nr:hypothetical protein J6590_003056 [Homalodisca vitripennis]